MLDTGDLLVTDVQNLNVREISESESDALLIKIHRYFLPFFLNGFKQIYKMKTW